MNAIASMIGSADQLHERASEARGLSDFGEDDYREGLSVLLDSYATEAGLTERGAARISKEVQRVLEARLLTEEQWRRHPAHRENPVAKPVFVTGLPRSGTTALHRLLCLDEGHQGLEQWLTDSPQPRPPREAWPENPDYCRVRDEVDARHRANPAMKGVHFMSADSVEECGRLERQSMRSIVFESIAHLPSYSRWLREQDMVPGYARHRQMLQLIGQDEPEIRWVLKYPAHIFAVDALLEVYPDALIVQTHRDPRSVIASISSLCQKATAGMSTVFTAEGIGRDCLDLWARGSDVMVESRRRHDPARFVDVFYDDFVRDADGTVERIYDHFAIPMTESTRTAIREHNEETRIGERRPEHRYALADFGLDEAQVVERFATYMGEFGHSLSTTR